MTMTDRSIIFAENLQKSFGRFQALDGTHLVVNQGEIHGFLGPNGAGKSTTIRAILGQLRIDSGQLLVFGQTPWSQAVNVHQRLAYVPGDVALWPKLTGGQCLDVLAGFHSSTNTQRRQQLIEAFELDPTKRAHTYSKGNRQKVALIGALSLDVDLYIFDEPTSGLDPLMEVIFQREVKKLAERGATVLLSSHILDEVEALCSHVSILRAGKTISTGSLEQLRQSTTTTILATLPNHNSADRLHLKLKHLSPDITADETGVHLMVSVHRGELAAAVSQVAATNPLSLVVRPPSLDELFLQHYETKS